MIPARDVECIFFTLFQNIELITLIEFFIEFFNLVQTSRNCARLLSHRSIIFSAV